MSCTHLRHTRTLYTPKQSDFGSSKADPSSPIFCERRGGCRSPSLPLRGDAAGWCVMSSSQQRERAQVRRERRVSEASSRPHVREETSRPRVRGKFLSSCQGRQEFLQNRSPHPQTTTALESKTQTRSPTAYRISKPEPGVPPFTFPFNDTPCFTSAIR